MLKSKRHRSVEEKGKFVVTSDGVWHVGHVEHDDTFGIAIRNRAKVARWHREDTAITSRSPMRKTDIAQGLGRQVGEIVLQREGWILDLQRAGLACGR